MAQAPVDLALDGDGVLIADGLYGVVRALDTTSGVETVVASMPLLAAAAGVAAARRYLDDRATDATPVLVYGGRVAVSDTVTSQVRQVLAAP